MSNLLVLLFDRLMTFPDVNREALEQLDLSETDLKRIEDLEILSHSVILECFKYAFISLIH